MIPAELEEYARNFRGREWLLPQLLDWIDNSTRRMFLITGPPGAGKSLLLAWLAGAGGEPANSAARGQLERFRSFVTAAHFCVSTTGSITPRAFIDNVARQLCRRLEGFATAMMENCGEQIHINVQQTIGELRTGGQAIGVEIKTLNLGTMTDEAALRQVLAEPLRQCCRNDTHGPLIILVDSLDEAASYSGAMSIGRLLTKLDDLPPQIRVLASTRPDPRILRLFREVESLGLDQAPYNHHDVQAYANECLCSLEDGVRDQLAERVARAADGNFLYARLAIDDMLAHPSRVPDLPNQDFLPSGLTSLYSKLLNREIDDDERRWEYSLKPVLGLIAAARDEGLTRTQLDAISGRDTNHDLRALKQYLTGELPHGPFRIFHESFRGFLFDDADNIDFRIDAAAAHRALAAHCLAQTTRETTTVNEYCGRNLIVHLLAGGELDRALALIDKPWLEQRFVQCGYNDTGFDQDVERVWQALAAHRPGDVVGFTRLQGARVAVAQRVGDFTDEDLVNLVSLDRVAEAKAHAMLRPRPRQRVESLLVVDEALATHDGADTELLDRAAEILPSIRDRYGRAELQQRVVKCNARSGRFEQAEAIARDIEVSSRRKSALGITATALARAGEDVRARELAGSDAEGDQAQEQGEALAVLALRASQCGEHDRAEACLQAITHAKALSQAYADMAVLAVQTGRVGAAERLASSIPGRDVRARVLATVAAALPFGSERQSALERALAAAAAEDSLRNYSWHRAGLGLVDALIEAGARDDATQAAQTLHHAEDRSAALLKLALRAQGNDDAAASECFRLSRVTAQDCDRPIEQAEALSKLALELARVEHPDAASVFQLALQSARAIEHAERRAEALEMLAVAMAWGADSAAIAVFREAAECLQAVADGLHRENETHNRELEKNGGGGFRFINTPDALRVAGQVAEALAANGHHAEALDLVAEISWTAERAGALYRVSRGAIAAGDEQTATRVFDQTLSLALGIDDLRNRAELLFDLLEWLDDDRRPERDAVLDHCIRTIDSFPQIAQGLNLLRRLTTYLTARRDPQAAAVFEKMLDAAPANRPGYRRGQVLTHVIRASVEAGRTARACRIAELIGEQPERDTMLGYARAMDIISGGELANTDALEQPEIFIYWQQRVQHALALALARAGNHQRALKVADRIVYRLEYDLGMPETGVQSLIEASRTQDIPGWIEARSSPWIKRMAARDHAVWLAATDLPAARRLLEETAESVASLDDAKGRTGLLMSIVRAAIRIEQFDNAAAYAGAIEDSRWRLQVLSELAGAAAVAGHARARELVAAAEELARQLHAEGNPYDPLATLVSELLPAGTPWSEILYPEALDESLHSQMPHNLLAHGLVRAGRFAEALAHVGATGSDTYLDQLAAWAPDLEARQSGLSLSVLREGCRVVGWVDETWAAAHAILSD